MLYHNIHHVSRLHIAAPYCALLLTALPNKIAACLAHSSLYQQRYRMKSRLSSLCTLCTISPNKNRAEICALPQHVPLHLVALKFTHSQIHSATAVPRYIAPPYQPRRRMKIAIRLALLSPRHVTHRSCTVSLNKIAPLYHNTADKNRTEIYARISVRIYASYRKNRKI